MGACASAPPVAPDLTVDKTRLAPTLTAATRNLWAERQAKAVWLKQRPAKVEGYDGEISADMDKEELQRAAAQAVLNGKQQAMDATTAECWRILEPLLNAQLAAQKKKVPEGLAQQAKDKVQQETVPRIVRSAYVDATLPTTTKMLAKGNPQPFPYWMTQALVLTVGCSRLTKQMMEEDEAGQGFSDDSIATMRSLAALVELLAEQLLAVSEELNSPAVKAEVQTLEEFKVKFNEFDEALGGKDGKEFEVFDFDDLVRVTVQWRQDLSTALEQALDSKYEDNAEQRRMCQAARQKACGGDFVGVELPVAKFVLREFNANARSGDLQRAEYRAVQLFAGYAALLCFLARMDFTEALGDYGESLEWHDPEMWTTFLTALFESEDPADEA